MALQKVPRPYGRDEVVAAVIGAATTLFAERGPAAVSLREIAQAADVNLGLIYRHIGSKTDLLIAVLMARPGMAPAAQDMLEEATAMLGRGLAPPAYTVIVVRAALDGYNLATLGVDYPILEAWARGLRARLTPVDADLRAGVAIAMLLGWHALGRTILDVLGRAHLTPEDVARSLEPALSAFLSAGA